MLPLKRCQMSESSESTNDIDAVDHYGWNALHRAISKGDVSEVVRLLAAGANVEARTTGGFACNSTPLLIATRFKHFDVMRLLLDCGADIEARDNEGWTPLFEAVYDGPLKSIDYLIWKGANVNSISTDRVSMLRLAVNRPQVAAVVCETLVACGSEIDATDYHGRTSLMSAVDCRNQSDIVRSLLALNADTTITDNRGWDVSHTENAEILQLLSERSKKTLLDREQTRVENLARIRSALGIRLMQFAQPDIIGICLALAPLDLPPYVLLWIVDWLPRYLLKSHDRKNQIE